MAPTRPASESPCNQEERILWLLHSAWPEWTPAPVLSKISLQYNARIFSLRKKGWQIANKVETRNGMKHGSFRLATPGTFPNPNKEKSAAERMSTIVDKVPANTQPAPITTGSTQAEAPSGNSKLAEKVSTMGTLFSREEMVNFAHDAKHYPS